MRRWWATATESVATAGPMRVTAVCGPNGWVETEYGREVREAEERRLAARTPEEVARDRAKAEDHERRQLENWRQLYRAAGLKVTF